jgi:hypothetical protein
MATEAQIAANRLNAQKSTGPRSPEGKAAVARSALWHGLTAASLVAFDEDEADFDDFHNWLTRDLEPSGTLECSLVERIAVLSWRLRRVAKAEAALINKSARYKSGFPVPPDQAEAPEADAGTLFDQATQKISALSRHEATMERALNRALAMLERWQQRRWENAERKEKEEERADADRPLPEPGSAYTNPRPYMGRPEDGIGAK